jgi:hypothetical protein
MAISYDNFKITGEFTRAFSYLFDSAISNLKEVDFGS